MELPTGEDNAARLARLLSFGMSDGPTSDCADALPAEQTLSGCEIPFPSVPGYRIAGLLGEGGMGAVWRAEQLGTHRPVALKLLATSALGSPRARERFEREVDLASRLEHPNIARVYDSGTARGLSYYAMELIVGRHLDAYVKEHGLAPRQILVLLRSVCDAVQYAHQRGVIHRDLKPSNILVTDDGRPHVVDFGLARPISHEAGQTVTQEGDWAGTPAFMAPEQAFGSADCVDTRTDVYGLGATLYLLLTGHTPHETTGSRHEVMQRLVSQDVRRPRQMNAGLDAELESVLLKALSQDPERRYSSAGQLGRDIESYLRGDAVEACPPSRAYRFHKFVARYKGGVIAGAAVAGALLTGTVSTTIGLVKARHAISDAIVARDGAIRAQAAEASQRQAAQDAQRVAEAARNEAEHVSRFLQDLLAAASPHRGMNVGGILDLLNEASRKLDAGELQDHPLTEADLRSTLGFGFENLGHRKEASLQRRRELELIVGQFGERSVGAANAMWELARTAERPERDRLLEQSAQTLEDLLGNDDPRTAHALIELAAIYIADDDDRAEQILRRAIDVLRKHPDDPNQQPRIALGLGRLAELYQHVKGDLTSAEAVSLEAVQILERFDARESALITHWERHASILDEKGDWTAAEAYESKALELSRQLFTDPDYPTTRGCLWRLCRMFIRHEKFAQAEPYLKELWAMLDRAPGAPAGELSEVAGWMIETYAELGDKESEKRWRQRENTIRMSFVREGFTEQTQAVRARPEDAKAWFARGRAYAELGQFKQAAPDLERAIDLQPSEHLYWHQGIPVLLQNGDVEAYRRRRSQALARFINADRPASERIAKSCLIRPADGQELAAATAMADRALSEDPSEWNTLAGGLAAYRSGRYWRAVGLLETIQNPGHWGCGTPAAFFLAMAYHEMGRSDEARASFDRGLSLLATDVPQMGRDDLDESNFQDWILCQFARREAQATLSTPVDAKTVRAPSPADVDDAPLIAAQGVAYGRRGQFRQAAEKFAKAIDLAPDPQEYWHKGLPLLLQVGDLEGYRRRRSQELARFKNTSIRDIAHGVAKDCLMIPADGEELKIAIRLADLAASDPAPGNENPWYCQTKGMAEYRLGHYRQSIEWFARSNVGDSTERRAVAAFFTAMAHHKLGHLPQARVALARGISIVDDRLPMPASRDLRYEFQEWIICQIIRGEAEGTLKTSSPATQPAAR